MSEFYYPELIRILYNGVWYNGLTVISYTLHIPYKLKM